MKNIPIILVLLFCCHFGVCQTPKGASMENTAPTFTGKTFALIVGISRYQDPAIPSLEYADKDAIAFYEYLKARDVDTNSITILLNEKATAGDFWMSLNDLTEKAQKGDVVHIYFSGHGDVESKTIVQDGFLLPYNTLHNVYAAGAIAIILLKSNLATLSAKGAQVIFIVDACHAGNLVGGREGMSNTINVLKDKWADEIKILSCQPGESSLEGKQWGNGRGLFSFELMNGLCGLADKDGDDIVTVKELMLYLMVKVPDQAAPIQQNPIVSGKMEQKIATVIPQSLASIKDLKNDKYYGLVNVKGFDIDNCKFLSDSVKWHCREFQNAIDSSTQYSGGVSHFSPRAFGHLYAIRETDSTRVIIALMKRNLAALIINDVNRQIMDVVSNKYYKRGSLFQIPNADTRDVLLTLLGDKQIQQLGLNAKLYYMEALNSGLYNPSSAITLLDSAIWADSQAVYAISREAQVYYDLGDFSTSKKMGVILS